MSAHRRLWRGAATSVALCLTLSACTIDFFFELFSPEDLTESSEPTEQAAAAAKRTVEQERKAEKAVDEALGEPKTPEKLSEAVDARPRDPRYLLYRSYVSYLEDSNAHESGRREAFGLVENLYPEDDVQATIRFQELQLDVISRVLQAYRGEVPADRYERLVSEYCAGLSAFRQLRVRSWEQELWLLAAWDPCGT